ncbi:hypothetical protein [Hoeflea sp.]|uniref:hypothetical protein n=1 Tax=Hoeflea sp. TaxID=1940281 RepID=UPI003A8F96C4
MMRLFSSMGAAALGLAFSALTVQAEIDGHGPDAWRITGVGADDVLNMRMGPGTHYLVIDQLAPDARKLEQITCVPLLIPSIYHKLSDAQRADLPPRWCLMRSSDFSKAGWVAQRFIMEDGLEDGAREGPAAATDASLHATGDPQIDGAAALVMDLYAAFERANARADNPFMRPMAERYFFAGVISDMHGRGADLLYDAQDFQGEVTRVAPDPDRPMLRGMITINAEIMNFGRTHTVVFRLRGDTARPGAPIRIFRIEHDGWSFP